VGLCLAATKVSQASKPETADPLPAILDFKAQLDKAGIELLLVPVPPKAVIYPDKISAFVPSEKTPRLDVFHHEFYALLNKNGIKVLDLLPDFLTQRDDVEGLVYCKTAKHEV
jgi:alginate O-acetyltransferase complex protein AlgJ